MLKFTAKTQKKLIEVICCLFIFLFVYAAVSKLLDYEQFQRQLKQLPELGDFIGRVAWSIPVWEIGISLLLAWPKTRLSGFYSGLGILLIFTAYITGILFFSPYLPCSCGGLINLLSWNEHLLFNLVCIAFISFGIYLLRKHEA